MRICAIYTGRETESGVERVKKGGDWGGEVEYSFPRQDFNCAKVKCVRGVGNGRAEELSKAAVSVAAAFSFTNDHKFGSPLAACVQLLKEACYVISSSPFRSTDVDIFGSECEVDSL